MEHTIKDFLNNIPISREDTFELIKVVLGLTEIKDQKLLKRLTKLNDSQKQYLHELIKSLNETFKQKLLDALSSKETFNDMDLHIMEYIANLLETGSRGSARSSARSSEGSRGSARSSRGSLKKSASKNSPRSSPKKSEELDIKCDTLLNLYPGPGEELEYKILDNIPKEDLLYFDIHADAFTYFCISKSQLLNYWELHEPIVYNLMNYYFLPTNSINHGYISEHDKELIQFSDYKFFTRSFTSQIITRNEEKMEAFLPYATTEQEILELTKYYTYDIYNVRPLKY
jgi:hypothetical protein